MARRKKGVGPSNSFGYNGSFGNPSKGGVGPSNSFGYQGSFGSTNHVSPGFTAPTPGTAPAAPAVPGQPIDPQFEMQKAQAQQQLQVGQLGAAYQGANINNEYGFGTDKSNPYSQAKLLEESWKRSKLGTTNNYASSGQLNSGAYGRMQGENDRNYSIGVDRGTRDMNSALGNVALGQLQNSADYGVGLGAGGFESLINAFRARFGG